MLIISYLQRKCKNITKKLSRNLVNPEKSSTFAPDFALTASEQKNDAKFAKNRNADYQPLTKKMQRKLKKVA